MFLRASTLPWFLALTLHAADDPGPRYGVQANLRSFPQSSPKETLASVLKAHEQKRHDYLLAHLSDPDWVDERVEVLAGGFKEAVQDTVAKFDAACIKLLKRFFDEGEFETLDATAVVRHKEVKDRVIRFRKIDKRWYLQHSYRP
jgi:hypothetical protein